MKRIEKKGENPPYLTNTLSEYLLFSIHSLFFLIKKAGKQTNRKNRSIVITKLKGLIGKTVLLFYIS